MVLMKLPPSYMSLQPSTMLVPVFPSVNPLGVGMEANTLALFELMELKTVVKSALVEVLAVRTAVPLGHRATTAGSMDTVGVVPMVIFVVVGAALHPFKEVLKVYVPVAAKVVPTMLGFCSVLEKPLGPVQLNVSPTSVPPAKFNVPPAQIGAFEVGVEDGVWFFTKVNTGVWLVSVSWQVTSTTSSQVPDGILAVD